MQETLMHKPSYVSGVFQDERLSVHIGWTAHQGSFSDCLPCWNEAKDICLIFCGEDFTDPAEVEALKSKGHLFAPRDASYLVHSYEEYGLDFLQKINGRFCGVVVDLRKGESILFNDRYGLSRIYCCEKAGEIYFSSEAKALLRINPGLKNLDYQSFGEWFSCGCPLQNRSLFSGLSYLPCASRWILRSGEPAKKEAYFQPSTWEQLPTLEVGLYYEKLKDTFSRVLPRYFKGNRPIGVSLTGGVDSRMVMAWAKEAPDSLKTYTFGGTYRDCGDVRIARRVARICKQPHQVLPVGTQFLGKFAALAEKTVFLTDGAMDVSGSPDLFVNRMASDISPIRMTGNYGGEILRSLVAFKPMPIDESLLNRTFRPEVQRAKETYASELDHRRPSFVAFKQVPWHHFSRLSLELSQITLRSPYLDNELVALAFQAPAEHATSNAMALRLINDGNPAMAKIGTDRGLLHRPVPVVTELHHLYQEFTFRADYAYDYGMPDWLVRVDNALKPLHLEKLFLGRHKFYHFRYWYRNQLASYLKAILLDERSLSRPYLDRRQVENMVVDHTSGRRNHTLSIHRVLSAELIHRTLLD